MRLTLILFCFFVHCGYSCNVCLVNSCEGSMISKVCNSAGIKFGYENLQTKELALTLTKNGKSDRKLTWTTLDATTINLVFICA